MHFTKNQSHRYSISSFDSLGGKTPSQPPSHKDSERMNLVGLLSLFVIGSSGYSLQFRSELDEHWQQFKSKFKKSYERDEEGLRRLIWEERVKRISNHNLGADMGFHSFRRGLNKYSDLRYFEVLRLLNGFRIRTRVSKNDVTFRKTGTNVPDQIDWRKDGFVTSVKDQGVGCGACWAFSATGALEGQLKKQTGKLVSLSEQNLLDCCEEDVDCDGGDMETAFQCVKKMKGIDTEESYPYKEKVESCHFDPKNVGATCNGYVRIPMGDEEALKEAAATVGPISVAIDAKHKSFHDYKVGIFDEAECGNDLTDMTHALLLIGYGTENGKDYWMLKNSWGESFGMNGYIKMSRNKNNQCGIATLASYPVL